MKLTGLDEVVQLTTSSSRDCLMADTFNDVSYNRMINYGMAYTTPSSALLSYMCRVSYWTGICCTPT